MKAFLLLLLLTRSQASESDWKDLESCVGRLKRYENKMRDSKAMQTFTALDRRLSALLEGIHYTEYNSKKLKEFENSEHRDKLAPYLVSNASVACEHYESSLTNYLDGFKRFLMMFFITTLSISIYSAYLFTLLARRRDRR